MAKVRRQAADWARLIDQWRASSLALPAICSRYGLKHRIMQNWVYKTSLKRADEKARRRARSAETPRQDPSRVFKGFEGYLQADAYSAYDASLKDGKIVEVGCWMHALRKFYDARTSDPTRSHLMLAWVVGLYKVGEDAKKERKEHPEWEDATWHSYRHDLRSRRSRPLLDTIHTLLEAELPKAQPKSPIGEAIGYAWNHRAALIRPWEAGFLEIDNGASERAMKPVALGRKNWLFAGGDEGGRTAATLMSLRATCKNLGIDPFSYLRDVLDRASTHPERHVGELLPDRWKSLCRND